MMKVAWCFSPMTSGSPRADHTVTDASRAIDEVEQISIRLLRELALPVEILGEEEDARHHIVDEVGEEGPHLDRHRDPRVQAEDHEHSVRRCQQCEREVE